MYMFRWLIDDLPLLYSVPLSSTIQPSASATSKLIPKIIEHTLKQTRSVEAQIKAPWEHNVSIFERKRC